MIKNYSKKLKTLFLTGLVFGSSVMTNAQVVTLSYTGSMQSYTVPAGVYAIQIEATGAAGGQGMHASSGIAGKGARIIGTFEVVPGQVLDVLVGGQGQGAQYVGGGGGGTFVWLDATSEILVAAGGGGGGGSSDGGTTNINGMNATLLMNGTNGTGLPNGGGSDGEGGFAPATSTFAGGGAGVLSNGASGTVHGCEQNCTGGISLGAGGFGGGSVASTAANGGYGGGGGNNARCGAVGGGGGGGYSGGGAGGEVVSGEFNGGGGGGSFNGGINQDNVEGVGTGNGSVIIQAVCIPIEITYTTLDETVAGNGAIDVTVTGGGGAYSFDWDNDGTGDFDDSEDLVGVPAGTYTLVVQDESICDDATESIVVNSQLSLEELDLVVGVYPNPTTDFVTISVNGQFDYEVVDVNGKLVANGSANNSKQISFEAFANGTYLVKVIAAQGSQVITVLKQ